MEYYLVVFLAQHSKILGEGNVESLRVRKAFLQEPDPLGTAIRPVESIRNIVLFLDLTQLYNKFAVTHGTNKYSI